MLHTCPYHRNVARLQTNLTELRIVSARWVRTRNSQLLLEAERLLERINQLLDEHLKLRDSVERGEGR
jgi:hypothetical protein